VQNSRSLSPIVCLFVSHQLLLFVYFSSVVVVVFVCDLFVKGDNDNDDDEHKPVWPTWAVGVLSGV
jgi:hypothetical protein